ncbi:zinc finger protein PLAG1 isoform X2 [Oryzias latipes]|nr:zinc finger protein PLAG1 isoform X2 [Oryzias latipes]
MATHSPEKTHKCSYCEKMFHRKDHLKNHLHTHDPHKEAFTCRECGKSYNTKLGFKRHIALHAANSGDLTCQVCLQQFPSTGVLLEHLKTHSGKSSGGTKEKKHCCEHCERCFYTRKDVRRHMVVHTGRKDFLCQYCAQRFGRKDHLTRHVKKSHARELLRVKTEPTDLLGPVLDLPSGSIKAELLGMLTPKSHQPNTCPGLAVDPQPFFPPFSLKYPLGPNVTSYSPSPHQREQALKGELETYLMELQSSTPSSSSATQEPQRSSSKPGMEPAESALEDPNQEEEEEEEALSKMSTLAAVTTGDSLASSSPLMDFTQLFSFLPYSQVVGGSGPVNEEPAHLPQLSAPPPTSPDAPENPLPGIPSSFLSSMSTPTTLPRFHHAFQ